MVLDNRIFTDFPSHKNSFLCSYSKYVDNLGQTITGSMIFTLVSKSPYEPWLSDTVCHVLEVSLTPVPHIILPLCLAWDTTCSAS